MCVENKVLHCVSTHWAQSLHHHTLGQQLSSWCPHDVIINCVTLLCVVISYATGDDCALNSFSCFDLQVLTSSHSLSIDSRAISNNIQYRSLQASVMRSSADIDYRTLLWWQCTGGRRQEIQCHIRITLTRYLLNKTYGVVFCLLQVYIWNRII